MCSNDAGEFIQIWDTAKMVDIKSVYTTGYAVMGATAVGTLYLAAM